MITKHGICQVSIAPVRASASDESEIVTQLLFGDYVEVIESGQPWIKIYFPADDYEGWMDFKQLLYISEEEYLRDTKKTHPVLTVGSLQINGPIGAQHIIFGSNLPNLNESKIKMGGIDYEIDPINNYRASMVETSMLYLNTPYLWGGKGIFGIDCSGLTQIVAKIHGFNLPRDASKQVHIGQSVDFKDVQLGDFMYFINSKNIVHHVGIVTGPNQIIHASGHVRIDKFDEKGIWREDLNKYTHNYHSTKRL
jgi:gamma-D-glutamyl-L-lysine dipeptidyl-peptidase